MLDLDVFEIATKRVRYAPEFKRQVIDLICSSRSLAALAKEFGPTAWSIAPWVKQDSRNTGKGDGGLRTAEREKLSRLRRANRKLTDERKLLSKAAAWFATESRTSTSSSGL